MVLRVVLADDSAEFLESAEAYLARDDRLWVVGRAASGEECVRLSRDLAPDLILMDLRMPGMDGLQAVREIRKALPGAAVVIVTLYEHPEYRRRAREAGAAGYVAKSEFAEAISDVIGSLCEESEPTPAAS